jgi:hypothetical protein
MEVGTRRHLIPEVTRAVIKIADGMHEEITFSTKSFCKKWGEMLIDKKLRSVNDERHKTPSGIHLYRLSH